MNKYINLLIDDYADMRLRSRSVLDGIHEAVYLKRLQLRTFYTIDSLVKQLNTERNKYVIVISESKSKVKNILHSLYQKKIHPIFFNIHLSNTGYPYSSVIPNYYSASYNLTRILLDEYPLPGAFLCYNKDSFTDQLRLDGFVTAMEENKIRYEIFSHHGDIALNINNLIESINTYKNIICANDVIAVLLIQKMKERGIDPENFNITGCGDMIMGRFFKPSLTTISSNWHYVGVLAIDIYIMHLKKRSINNVIVNTDCNLVLRDSVHLKNKTVNIKIKENDNNEFIDFYNNDIVQEVDILEKMFNACDKIDFNILHGIINKQTYEYISEENSLAVNTVKYRLKKIENNLGIRDRKVLLDYLKKFELHL